LGCLVRPSWLCSTSELTLRPASSTERSRELWREHYRALFRRKVKKSPANPKGRRTNDARTPSIKAKQRHWAAVLQEAKKRWSENKIQEQARLLAAYHNVGSMRVPHWVKDVYMYMERYVLTGEHANHYTDKVLEQYALTIWILGSRTGHFLGARLNHGGQQGGVHIWQQL
jgi:hypothetical protein